MLLCALEEMDKCNEQFSVSPDFRLPVSHKLSTKHMWLIDAPAEHYYVSDLICQSAIPVPIRISYRELDATGLW